MNTTAKRVVFWIPRVLSILLAIFLSMFALDVFNEGYELGKTILTLLIHLIPTYFVIIASMIAWRRERLGGFLFIALALFYLITSRGGSWIISAPLIINGVLFLLNWLYKA